MSIKRYYKNEDMEREIPGFDYSVLLVFFDEGDLGNTQDELEKVSENSKYEKVKFLMVSLREVPDAKADLGEFDVYPTICLLEKGEEVDRIEGHPDAKKISKVIDKNFF